MPASVFKAAVKASNERQEQLYRHLGELVRGATVRLVNIQIPINKQFRDVSKFWQMPWDDVRTEEDEVYRLEHLTPEEKQKEVQKFLERIGDGGKQES